MKFIALFLGLLVSSAAFAKSGYNIIQTESLYAYVCGKSETDCQDTFVYKSVNYNIAFDYFDPAASAAAKGKFSRYLNNLRTNDAQIIGPFTATISIQQRRANGLKNLVILSASKLDQLLN